MNSASRSPPSFMNSQLSFHRTLSIPEILSLIFSYGNQHSNFHNALVCKSWSEVALDLLWYQVEKVAALFSLLSPLVSKLHDSRLEFSKAPGPTEWRTFFRYSKRVRQLYYRSKDEQGQMDVTLKSTAFDIIARTRPTFNILPKLTELGWTAENYACLEHSVIFMHPTVKSFILGLPDNIDVALLGSYFQDVLLRMPDLENFDLRTTMRMSELEKAIVPFFTGLTKLAKLTIPMFHLTTPVTRCLSGLEHLGVIEFQYDEDQGFGHPNDVEIFSPNLKEGAFPALYDFSLCAQFCDAARLFDGPFPLTNLTILFVDSFILETPSTIRDLLDLLSRNVKRLKELSLVSLITETDSAVGEEPDPESQLSFATLKPVMELSDYLTSFEILHRYPISVSEAELEELVIKLPLLTTLALGQEPALLSEPTLSFRALILLAKYCPSIEHVGLYLRTYTTDLPSPKDVLPQFKRLEKFSTGSSPLNEEEAENTALFLSRIFPPKGECLIRPGVTWDLDPDRPGTLNQEMAKRGAAWDKVQSLIPILTKLREEERVRTLELVKEVEDLRIRNEILMAEREVTGKKGKGVLI